MKTLSIINLHKAEIKKNLLAKIRGGEEIKCFCTATNPYVVIKKQGGSTKLCYCDEVTTSTAGVYSSTPD
ncbi:MAG: hypothetical protein ABIJ04_00695 [Bacteroidota bacterium]